MRLNPGLSLVRPRPRVAPLGAVGVPGVDVGVADDELVEVFVFHHRLDVAVWLALVGPVLSATGRAGTCCAVVRRAVKPGAVPATCRVVRATATSPAGVRRHHSRRPRAPGSTTTACSAGASSTTVRRTSARSVGAARRRAASSRWSSTPRYQATHPPPRSCRRPTGSAPSDRGTHLSPSR